MFSNLCLVAVFAPFISFLLTIGSGRWLGRKGSIYITIIGILTSLLSSLLLFRFVAIKKTIISIKLFSWLNLGSASISFGFLFDSLSCTMLCVITLISSLVHIYSVDYLSEDPHLPRFMSYLSFFTFLMLILVSADNFLQLFLGWEGVGLASYLLINFWYTRIEASKAAIKAIIMNRIGDFFLCIGMFAIFAQCYSLDFGVVFALIPYMQNAILPFGDINYITFVSLLLFGGAVGKSAQIGLHTWLPDAMEGPTPVSALIHAATMVTAGVFLIIRCSPIIEFSETALLVITIVGGITAIFAATIGIFQNDMKKVIAYSTCSQLGYMVFACGLSCYHIAFFHLVTHAVFKALLFLGAGSVIHGLSDEQDMRKMGGLVKVFPLTYTCMLIGSLALMGFPFLSGFYSKELILEMALGHYTPKGLFVYILGCFAAFFTSFYSTRLLVLVFITRPNGSAIIYKRAHDAPKLITLCLFVLAVLSILTGYLSRDLIAGLGSDFLAIYIAPHHQVAVTSEFLNSYLKLIPLIFSFAGLIFGFFLYTYFINYVYILKQNKRIQLIIEFFTKKWYFDIIYNKIAKSLMNFGYNISFKTLDRGLFEKLGSSGIAKEFTKLSEFFIKLQTGYIYHYALVIILGISTFLCIFYASEYVMIPLGLLTIYFYFLFKPKR